MCYNSDFIKKHFSSFSLFITILLFSFHFWLYWPGYIQDDSQTTLLLMKNGWHPVIMAYLIQGMYTLFGIHVYHLFLLNLIPYYISIWIIADIFYYKTKSYYSLICFFPCFIGNVFYAQIRLGCSSFSFSWILLLYAITLYLFFLKPALSKNKKRLIYLVYAIVFIISLLSRHNAIIQVWPVTFIWIASYLENKRLSPWQYLCRFGSSIFLSAVFCVTVLMSLTTILVSSDFGNVYPATPTILHHIVGCCAPEKDETCFGKDWWSINWKFKKNRMDMLKQQYEYYMLNAEPFIFANRDNVAFKNHTELNGRLSKLFYAIQKYPLNWLAHIRRFFAEFWFLPADLIPQKRIQKRYSIGTAMYQTELWNPVSLKEKNSRLSIAEKIPNKEFSVKFTSLQNKIDRTVRYIYPSFNMFIFVLLNFIFFFTSIYLFVKNRKNILHIFLLSTSVAGVLSQIIIPAFSPIVYSRYMEPVTLCAILNIYIFTFIIIDKHKQQKLQNRNIFRRHLRRVINGKSKNFRYKH